MKCSRCNDAAIISRRISGNNLCAEHFTAEFEQSVRETLIKGQMIKDGDKIAVALSGGKDSTALLYVLHKMRAERRVELIAITIDEGIKGYRDDTMKSARKIVENLGVDQEILSFRDDYGFDLDHVVQNGGMPCTICGVFRKNALNRTAKRLRANKLATGHNLDDEVQSIMMNYLKGDIERLMRLRPMKAQPGLVPRIKPFREIPEKEIAIYGMVNEFYAASSECPYASISLRSDVRDMLNVFENLTPGTKLSILNGYEKIIGLAEGRGLQMDLSFCKICGEPCVRDLCKACELLAKIKSKTD